jgi:4-hydroxy-tetrahydrodipicolinate synthase
VAEGRVEAALDLFDLYLPLMRYEQQPGIGLVVRKWILHRRGALADPFVRPPSPRLTAETRAEVERLLARLERRLAAAHG